MKQITQNLRWLVTLLAMIVSVGAWAAETETIVFSQQGYSNGEAITSVEGDGFSISFNKGTNPKSYAPTYYDSGSSIRCYGGNYFTVNSSNTITKIVLSFGKDDDSNTITTDVGSYSKGTWTGSATSITFTVGGSTGNRRISSIAVTYSSGSQQTISAPTFSLAEGTYNEAQTVEISCSTVGATIYYTTDGNNPTTSSTTYTVPISISETKTLKAIASYGTEISSVVSATYTIAALVVDYATLPFVFDGGKDNIGNVVGLTQSSLGTDYETYPKLKFDDSNDVLILKFNERPGTLSFDIKGNSFSGGTFKVQTSIDGINYTDFITYTRLGATQSEAFNNLDESVRYIKWIYTNKSSGNVALGNIKLMKYDASQPDTPTGTIFTKVNSIQDLVAGYEYIIVNEESSNALSTTQNTNNRDIASIFIANNTATINADTQIFTLEGDDTGWYFNTGDGYLYAASSSENYLRTEATPDEYDNAKATIVISNGDATIEFQGIYTHNLLKYNRNSKLFSCYLSSSVQQPVQLYKKKIDFETVNISNVGWATYVTNNALDFSDRGVKAYIIEPACIFKDKHEIGLTEISKVPKGTAILINGSENSYKIPTISDFVLSNDNALRASDGSVEGNGKIYVLNQVNGVVGFYPLNNGKKLSAGKAYLDMTNYLSESSDDVKYFFSFGNETVDAINKMDAEEGLGVLYNLNGQRVAAPLKGGIYIMNGKKVFISTLKTN